MSTSCAAEEISVPDIEGIRIYWKVNNRSIVKKGETVAVYCTDPQKSTDTTEGGTSQPSDAPIIRAKKRGPRAGQGVPSSKEISVSESNTGTTATNKPSLGTLIGKILSTAKDQTLINSDNNRTILKGVPSGPTPASLLIPIVASSDGILFIYPMKQLRQSTTIQSIGNLKEPITVYQIIGKIEPCSHPTIIDGLCVICGERMMINNTQKHSSNSSSSGEYKYNQQNNLSSASHDSLTISGGITVSITSDYAASIATQTLSTLRRARKLQLVLDLDHTLVHATADERAEYWKQEAGRADVHTILLPMFDGYPTMPDNNNNNSPLVRHFMKFRNYLAEFLDSVMDKYEVIIYTAGTRAYANKTADAISRHLLNYQKKKDNCSLNLSSPYCMDEVDLCDLRARVAQMDHDAKIVIDTQSRKRMVALANEQWKRNNSNIADNNDAMESLITDDQIQTPVDVKDENEIPSGDKIKSLKRKRVAFCEEGTTSDIDSIDLSTMNHTATETQADTMNLSSDLNPTESLEIVQGELKEAESRENEAIALRMKLFGSRIVSRTDVGDLGRDVKSLSRVFPCGGKMAVIVDDREDVWANADDFASEKKTGEPPDNLLLIRPFHWRPFLGYADINNASGVDITKQGDDTSAETADDTDDIQLVWTSDILSRLYDRYYSQVTTADDDDQEYETVPSILRQMRKEVLGGDNRRTNIVLSGVIPINIQELTEEKGSSTRPPLIRYVEALGAQVHNDVTTETTHVVAARDGTDKVKRARQVRGCCVVHVSWLMECYWSISLRDTKSHLINHYIGVISRNKPAVESAIRESNEDDDGNFSLDAEYE